MTVKAGSCLLLPLLLAIACGGPPQPRSSAPTGPPPEAVVPPPATEAPPEPRSDSPTETTSAETPPGLELEPQAPLPDLHEEASPAPLRLPATVRIGLASDLLSVSLPCCDGELSVPDRGSEPSKPWGSARRGPVTVLPMVGGGAAVYRLQVAALKDADRASALAADLSARTRWPAEAHFDASVGLYRVRVGRFATREAAEAGRARVPWSGAGAAFVVSESAELVAPGLKVTVDGRSTVVHGRWLAMTVGQGEALRYEARRYRHRLLVYLNDRGSLNVINELPFEDYLRGVVPKEMGPEQYNRLEALKAQAVAARTYTVAHLGQFESEGFDLCATPSCQVYGGLDAEHPVSDRALRETAGEVVTHQGRPIEALYTASCGGHTEDVEVVFPGTAAPYLAGRVCIEGGETLLPTGLPSGTRLATGVVKSLLPSSQRTITSAFAERARRLATLAGLEVPRERLASLDRLEVMRFLVSLFDLVLAPSQFSGSAPRASVETRFPGSWSKAEQSLARSLLAAGVMTEPLDPSVSEAELDLVLVRLALRLGVLERIETRYSHLEKAALWVMQATESRRLPLPGAAPAYRGQGENASARGLSLVPGDPLELWLSSGKLVAVIQRDRPRLADEAGARQNPPWTRFKSRAELAQQVEQRYPGLGFEGFEVVSRGRSGRVGKLRLLGGGGRVQMVEGLAVRWLLDVPETWFSARETRSNQGTPGWQFTGKGWGHGVGLCQIGAFGMATRGSSYTEILTHYYTGTELVRLALGPSD